MGPLEEQDVFFTTELSRLVKWMALEHMMLSEKSQMQKDRYHLFPAEGQIPSIPSHGQEQISHGFKRSIIISLKIRERCKNSVSS